MTPAPSELLSEGRTGIADSDTTEELLGGLRLTSLPQSRRDRKRIERILAGAAPEERSSLRRQLLLLHDDSAGAVDPHLSPRPKAESKPDRRTKRNRGGDARNARARRFAELIDLDVEPVVVLDEEALDLTDSRAKSQGGVVYIRPDIRHNKALSPLRTAAVFIGWIAIGAGLLVAAVLAVPPLSGHRTMVVLSGSMSPALEVGDVVVDRTVSVLDVKVDDIITFRDPIKKKRTVTHRVRDMKVENGSVLFTTRGDSNTTDENWKIVATGKVGRVVLRIPKIGYALGWAWSPKVRVAFVAIPMILFGVLEIIAIWRSPDEGAVRSKKTTDKRRRRGPKAKAR